MSLSLSPCPFICCQFVFMVLYSIPYPATETKPDIVVQVVLLAEDSMIQDKMSLHGVELQTVADVSPIQIHPARVLSKIYSLLGEAIVRF